MRAILIALAIVPMIATAAEAKSIKAKYSCKDGTKINATFYTKSKGPGSVDLKFTNTGKLMSLPQGMSADGGRYVSGMNEFWVKGNNATLTRGHKETTCRAK